MHLVRPDRQRGVSLVVIPARPWGPWQEGGRLPPWSRLAHGRARVGLGLSGARRERLHCPRQRVNEVRGVGKAASADRRSGGWGTEKPDFVLAGSSSELPPAVGYRP